MKKSVFTQVPWLLASLLFSVSCQPLQVRPEDYVGCFNVSQESRMFVSSPGDYSRVDLSPLDCLQRCGRKYRFAALQDGNLCLCADSLPTSGKVDDALCSESCPGSDTWPAAEQGLKCGGELKSSIYTATDRILGFRIQNSDPLPLLEPVTLSASLVNGRNATFGFELGDGTITDLKIPQPEMRHIYDQPGSYKVTFRAANQISGTVSVSKILEVDDPPHDGVELACPAAARVGDLVECNGTLIRGSRVNATFQLGDGSNDTLSLSARYYSAGPNIPRNNVSAHMVPAELSGPAVMQAYEFRHDGRITHWEFESDKTGVVQLQVYRPVCLADEAYCQPMKTCLPSDEPCHSSTQVTCPDSQTFCLFRGHCLENVNVTNCSVAAPYHTTVPRADYQLVRQSRVSVASLGHHIEPLSEAEQPFVRRGDVLGWSSEGGVLAHQEIDIERGATFEYGLELSVGDVLRRSDSPIKHHKHFIMSAHYAHANSFSTWRRYQTPGHKFISSNVMDTVVVTIDEPITVAHMVYTSLMSTDQSYAFSVPSHPGTNASYLWEFGDGGSLVSQQSSVSYSYPLAGKFALTLTAFNSISRVVARGQVSVFESIQGLRFSTPIQAEALGQETRFEWGTVRGTNLTYVVDFGDGSERYRIDTTGSASRTGSAKHRYGAVGNYSMTLYAYNLVGPNSSVAARAVVEIPVSGLEFSVPLAHVTNNVYLATGDHMTVTRVVSTGTNVECTFDFRDGTAPVRTSDESVSHRYAEPGTFRPNVSCSNAVNSVHRVLNATVVVQDLEPITGLSLHANATVLGAETDVLLAMTFGTTFFCSWDFGDGSEIVVTDFSHLGQPMSHTFPAINTYDVMVKCTNRLGSQHAQVAVPLDIAIAGVAMVGSPHYVQVGEAWAAYVTVTTGSRMTFRWDYGDQQSDEAFRSLADPSTPVESTHAYIEGGQFAVSVSVSNSLGSVSQALSVPVEVEYPAVDISLTSDGLVSVAHGNLSFELTLPVGVNAPSNALCVWDFGDGSAPSDPEPLVLSSFTPHPRTHRFTQEGTFVSTVNISNHVSSLVLKKSVEVQKLVAVQLSVGRLIDENFEPGFGRSRDFFRQDEMLILNVSSQKNDLKYVWDFGDGSAPKSTFWTSVQHTYGLPGTYTVQVVVRNKLAELKASHQITVQKPPGQIAVNCSEQNFQGEPSFFTIYVSDAGTDGCVTLDLADTHVAIFGRPACRPDVLKPNHTFVAANVSSNASLVYEHTYSRAGDYRVTLTAHNTASQRVAHTNVFVRDSPCKTPNVQIENDGTVAQPYTMPMSQVLVLKNKVAFDCPVARSVHFAWRAFVVSVENPDDESARLDLPLSTEKTFELPVSDEDLEKTALVLKERTLPFALLKFQLLVTFTGIDRDLSSVVGSHGVWIKVERSELVPVIAGGRRRAVGHGLNMALDATSSKDPDVGKNRTGILYEWACRRKDEQFPAADQPANPRGGCWENGTYTFGYAEKVSVFTGYFVQKAVYMFRLTIRKDAREKSSEQELTVLPGQPPTMVFKCTFNCYKKKNPLEPLNMESKCVDGCAGGVKIFYEWILYMRTDSGGDSRRRREADDDDDGDWMRETDWINNGTSTGVSKANLVINRNVLRSGREYRLRLNAWKRGGEDAPGFTEEQFTVNTPPHGGQCTVTPLEGFALDTDFSVQCANWQDPDIPLRYLIELKNGADIIPLYAGYETKTSAVFSMGKRENNFTVEVRVKVEDAYGMTASTIFHARVLEPTSVDYGAVIGDMGSAVGDDGAQAALQSTNALNSVLNAKAGADGNDTQAAGERAKFRGQVADMMTEVPADSFDAVAQKGVALEGLTQATGEVSEDAQNATVNALSEMGNYLQNSENDKNLEGTAKSMFSAIGNVVGAATGTAQKAINGTAPGADPSASMNNTKSSLDVVDKVSGAFMKQLVAGDKAKAIKTPNLDLAIGRKSLETLGGEDEEEEEEEDEGMGGVKLPDPMALFGGANASTEEGATSAIGTTMTAMDNNPFAWDNSSKDLDSKTVGVALTDGNGKPLDLAGQELEVFVPRDTLKNPVQPMEIHHFAEDDPPMRVHKFNRSNVEAGVAVEVLPFDDRVIFMVAVRYGKKPSASHFDFSHTYPTLLEAKKIKKKKPHPFTFVISNDLLNNLTASNGSAPFYLGIKAINKDKLNNPNTTYGLRIYLPSCKMFLPDLNTWTSKGCRVGPKTITNSTHCICQPGAGDEDDDEDGTEEPTAGVLDSPHSSQSGDAAPTKPATKRRRFKKSVSKVSFASSFFVAPNPIDFNKVFNVNLAENPISLATVLSIFGVYLVLAIYSRREDLKDVERAGVTPLEDNDPADRHHYEITVYTGFGKQAATTSKVFFTLSGEEGESEPRGLSDPKRRIFQRRGVDEFLATFPESLGELNYLHIWHDNSGKSASWYLSRVIIHDLNSDKKYLFICESWLAVEKGDGTVDRLIPVAGHEEMTSFNHLFHSTTQKNLADGHLWFSIFMRPARSRFTRLQRLSCCLTLLYLSMLTNAMFYQIGGESDPATSIQLGPLSFSPAQVGIGVMSSLIIVPINLLIVGIFRGVEPKPTKAELQERRKGWFWWLRELFFCFYNPKERKDDFIEIMRKNHKPDEFLDFSSRTNITKAVEDEAHFNEGFGLGDDDINFKISREEQREEEQKKLKKKKKKKKKMLPYWWLYVGWTLCFLTCFTAAFFVVLYGLQFGKEKSAQWISSMLVTFFQDVLISQPLKVVAVALVIALIVKKPQEEEEEEDKKKNDDEEWLHDDAEGGDTNKRMKPKSMIRFQPPDKDKLKKAREQRFKEMKMTAIIKEVVLYVFFVASLCIVSYSHRDPTSFQIRRSMEDAFINNVYGGARRFDSIGSRENFYSWAETSLVNALFFEEWYNGQWDDVGYAADQMAYVIGGARLRQVRVEDDSCSVPHQFSSMVRACHDWYGFSDEDTGQYDVAWEPLKNESLYDPPFTYQAWEFNTSGELNTLPFMAYVTTYGGGGFVAELGDTRENALLVIDTLRNGTWIDAQTRAVITEIATYNAVANLFCVMTLVVEFLPTNGVFLYTDFKIARLFTFGGGFETFLMVCEFAILFFFGNFIYVELKQLYKMRKGYFKEFWNCIEFLLIVLVFTAVGMYFTRVMLVGKAIARLEENPGQYVSFSRVASWNEAFMYVVACVVFLTWIKGIKLLRFNQRVSILARTLRGAAGPLGCFFVVFLVFFLAYALFAFAIFGQHLSSYYNFVSTCETVLGILLGAFDFLELQHAAPILGPIYFFSFMVFGSFILTNMFLTIVMDVFSEVKGEVDGQDNEYEIVDFMIGRFKKVTGLQSNKVNSAEDKKTFQATAKKAFMAMSVAKGNGESDKKLAKAKQGDVIEKRFSRLESTLADLYCDDWAEERILDHFVERRWGVDTEKAYAEAQAELSRDQEREELRHDMYAALERYGGETGGGGGEFRLSLDEPPSQQGAAC